MERDEEEDGVETVDEDFAAAGIVHPYDPAKTKIDSVQTTLDTLLKRLRHDEIDMQPSFQRAAGLWTATKMSRLIESLLIRIPLPAFYFDGSSDDRWLVVDGVQRLSALHRFVLEPDPEQRLRLVDLEYLRDVVGKTHDELPRSIQRRIDETQVTLHIIRPGTPPEVKYNIFRRINTGGLVLTPQEIRHALNPGPALDFLEDLAKGAAFVAATDGSVDPKRMLDRELVLRFCAFTLHPPTRADNLQGNVDRFLTAALETLNRSTDRYEDLRQRFTRAMRAARDIFGNDAFRKRLEVDARRHPINKALFEAWAFWLGQVSDDEIARLVAQRDRVGEAMISTYSEDPSFLAAISVGTGDPGKVRHRFHVIGALISGILWEGELDDDLGSRASELQGV